MQKYRTLIAVATLAAAGCASSEKRRASETGVYAESSAWLNPSLEKKDIGEADHGVRAASANPALRPTDPWLGSVGVKLGALGEYDVGAGVCVPGVSVLGQPVESTDVDRMRRTAVGVWLKRDF